MVKLPRIVFILLIIEFNCFAQQNSQESKSSNQIIFKEFNGVSDNGDWRKQYGKDYFPGCNWNKWFFEVKPNYGKMHLDGGYGNCPAEGNNQHVVRYDKIIDQRRSYTIECDFYIEYPFPSRINSFAVNFNIQNGLSRDDKINCWSINLDIHEEKTGRYSMKSMGFKKGSFRELLPNRMGSGAKASPQTNHLKIEVNRRLDGSPSSKWVTVTWLDTNGVREYFEVNYKNFPYQPKTEQPVRIGFNTHGTEWVVRNLKVYY